ncbi:flavoprotein, partial [Crossiella equi]
LTTSAARFVSPHAVAQLTGAPPLPDRWPEDPVPGAPHVELARWCDTAVVFPACLHFLSRLALGLADTPALLALHCLTAPIGLAPSLPPGADRNPIVRDNLARLADRENVVVAPTTPARSLTTGHKDAAGSCPLWTLLELVEARRGDEPCSS